MVWQGGTGDDSRTTNELGATFLRRGGLGCNHRFKWGGIPPLSTNPRARVESWDDTWNPTLAGALSDQRVEEFMIMQQSLVHKKPQRVVRDGWEWIRAQFSVIGAYKRLYEGQYEESRSILKACRLLWRQKVPIKVRFFGWLLFLRRLMTRVIYKHSYLETATSCTLCSDGEEDCAYLFFECPLARMLSNRHTSPRVNTTPETSFWDSIQKIGGKRREEGVRIFAVLWAIWLHWNNKLFNGRAAFTEGIIYAVEGFVAAWSSRPGERGGPM